MGTPILISGVNFSPVPSYNVVYFGAVRAQVTEALPNRVTALLPPSATYAPLTLTVGGLTACASNRYLATFPSSQALDGGCFTAQKDFASGPSPTSVDMFDLDGDGKPDLVINSSSGINVLRNTSVNGNISFANLITIGGEGVFAIGDVDGDGLPDVVAGNTVYRNTSSPGIISFASGVGFARSGTPNNQVLYDVDGDGKLDLIAADYATVVRVLRNTSVPGAVSFAPELVFYAGVYGVARATVGDLDGDGKPEIAVTHESQNVVSILRNQCTPGTINFDPKIDFPVGSTPEGVVMVDLDGDGKLDVVTANYWGASISVLKNLSTPGTIALAGQVMFTTTGKPAELNVADLDGDGRPDLVIAPQNFSPFCVLRNTCSTGTIDSSSFAPKVDIYASWWKTYDAAVGDLDGDGRPDLAFVNYAFGGPVSVLRNVLTLPPVITNIEPKSGPPGLTATISGANFSPVAANNSVYFGGMRAPVITASDKALRVQVPTNGTYAPLSVTASGFTAYSVPFVATFPSNRRVDSGSFAPRIDFSAANTPKEAALGDLDGDGLEDIVIVHAGGAVLAYRNLNTNGSFSTASLAGPVAFAAGSSPWAVALGDLNGDGKLDMAVANYGSGTVSILRNLSERGVLESHSFSLPMDLVCGGAPASVAIADVDVDGRPDLLVLNMGSGTVAVLRNLGTNTDGTLSFAPRLDLSVSGSPQKMAVGDLDQDGKPELVVVNSSSTTISIFRNTSLPGSIVPGSFATPLVLPAGSNPSSAAIGDLNGDGKPEIIIANSGSFTVSILPNASVRGNLSFGAAVNFGTGPAPATVALADLTGDGKPELVVANRSGNSISVLRNVSSGPITSSSFLSKVDFVTGANPEGVAIGDLDGDGKPGIAVGNSAATTISVFRNTMPPALIPPTITSLSSSTGAVGSTVTIFGSNFNAVLSNNLVYFGPVLAPVTSVSSISLVVTVPAGAAPAPITVIDRENALSGRSAGLFEISFPGSALNTASLAGRVDFGTGTSPDALALGDFNQDGKADLAVANYGENTVSILLNLTGTNDFSFAPATNFATGTSPSAVAVGDFNGDGKLDLVAANKGEGTVSVLLNGTAGNTPCFTNRVGLLSGGNARAVAVGDFNRDGKLDLAVVNDNSNSVSVLLNITEAGAAGPAFLPRTDFATGYFPYSVAVGDINGDGAADLVVANYERVGYPGMVSVLLNTTPVGSLLPQFSTKTDFQSWTHPLAVALADFNLDGKLDVAVQTGSSTLSLLRNITSVGAGTPSFASAVQFGTGANSSSLAVGDLNGDGRPDVAGANLSGNTYSLLPNLTVPGTDSLLLGSAITLPTGGWPFAVAMGDLNGDGQPDLAVANYTDNSVSIFRNSVQSDGPPHLPGILDQVTGEDTPTMPLPFTVWDVGTPADNLLVSAYSSNPALVPDANIILGGSGSNRTVTLYPLTNQFGSASISIVVSDGTDTTTNVFLFSVTAVNDPPFLGDILNQTIMENQSLSDVPFTVGDVESAASELVLTASSSSQSLVPDSNIVFGGSGPNRTVSITPAANQQGQAVITIRVSDGSAVASATFILTVNPSNTPPVISSIANQTISEDTTASIGFTVSDAQTTAAGLIVTGSSSNPALVPNANLLFGGSGSNRTVTITPATNQSGTSTITINVSDGATNTTAQFALTVTPVPDPVVAKADTYSVPEDNVLTSTAPGVLANDANIDNVPVRAELACSPSNGVVQLSTNGSFAYTPRTNFNGTDTFCYDAVTGNTLDVLPGTFALWHFDEGAGTTAADETGGQPRHYL